MTKVSVAYSNMLKPIQICLVVSDDGLWRPTTIKPTTYSNIMLLAREYFVHEQVEYDVFFVYDEDLGTRILCAGFWNDGVVAEQP